MGATVFQTLTRDLEAAVSHDEELDQLEPDLSDDDAVAANSETMAALATILMQQKAGSLDEALVQVVLAFSNVESIASPGVVAREARVLAHPVRNALASVAQALLANGATLPPSIARQYWFPALPPEGEHATLNIGGASAPLWHLHFAHLV